RPAAGEPTGTPAAVPLASTPARPRPATAAAHSADLGRGAHHHPDTDHTPSRRGTHDETDVDRQTRQGGDPRPGGGVPDVGAAPRASAQRLTPLASGASVDVDRHGRAATMEPGARECGHESGGSTDYRRLPGPAGDPARPAGAELCEHAPAAGAETGQAAAPGRDDVITRRATAPYAGRTAARPEQERS